jgi:hypothetical protein
VCCSLPRQRRVELRAGRPSGRHAGESRAAAAPALSPPPAVTWQGARVPLSRMPVHPIQGAVHLMRSVPVSQLTQLIRAHTPLSSAVRSCSDPGSVARMY